MALPAFAAERRAAALCCGAVAARRPAMPLSINISCPHGAQQQTPPHAAAAVGGVA